ncbi:histidine kinase [Alkalicaulis satelles]|uniref:histidine kinase n=1 Tax=Alkalicaulis satelles TaxID=2609175 RepID=A0A5M6ZKZ4_9PROT|nr:histidine kinase [Alkalicaulis satelles]
MVEERTNRRPLKSPDRPRRRDIALTAGLGVFIMAVLALSGEMEAGVFLAGSLALAGLAAVYYLTALTAAEPSARPAEAGASLRPVEIDACEAMLERLPIPVLLIGPGGRIERANPSARAFLGLGAERGLLSTALRQPRVLEAVSAALRGERGAAVEYSTLAPLESHVRAFVEPIRLDVPGPMPFRAMLVLADDTSSKRAERMRADFLANASHELRTPLASLSGFLETLQGPAHDDEEARDRFLAIMKEQTERMRRLIDDLLSLSRVEMNEHVAPTGSVELNDLARDVTEALRLVAERRAITLELTLADTPAQVRGDHDQIYEVVENLVENAIKYSPDGSQVRIWVEAPRTRDGAEHMPERMDPQSGRLTLSAPPLDPDARFAVVRVRDNGPGIERRYLPRLAERFFRVDGQKSGPTAGTGLGLAIVKHIVSRHRGGFTVESAPGAGSVFSAFFMLAPAQATAPPAPPSGTGPVEQTAGAVTKV